MIIHSFDSNADTTGHLLRRHHHLMSLTGSCDLDQKVLMSHPNFKFCVSNMFYTNLGSCDKSAGSSEGSRMTCKLFTQPDNLGWASVPTEPTEQILLQLSGGVSKGSISLKLLQPEPSVRCERKQQVGSALLYKSAWPSTWRNTFIFRISNVSLIFSPSL